jgi:cytochrome c556
MLRRFEPMGIQLREGTYAADVFRQHAEALAEAKASPWDCFGADTQYPPSKSDDRLWREPEIFAAERDEFMRAVDALRLAVQDAPREAADATPAIRAAYARVEKSCRSCHKRYKH